MHIISEHSGLVRRARACSLELEAYIKSPAAAAKADAGDADADAPTQEIVAPTEKEFGKVVARPLGRGGRIKRLLRRAAVLQDPSFTSGQFPSLVLPLYVPT